MRKRKLEEIKNELFTDKFDNKDSVKIFASLNNPDVQKDIIRNLMKPKNNQIIS
jgi:hypothetical protein